MKLSKVTYVIILLIFTYSLSFAADNSSKFKIKSVKFAGNHAYTDKRLKKVIFSKPSMIFNPVYYYPDVLQDDLAGLVRLYKYNGYLNMVIESYSVKIDSTKKRAYIHIRIDEGELTRIDGITLFGNEVIDDQTLMKTIPLKPGDPLRHDGIAGGTLGILTLYSEYGHLDAVATPEVRLDTLSLLAQIDYFIKEKEQFSIDQIIYKGAVKTKDKVVTRELEFKSGDIINYSKLLKSQRNLYLTGIFQSVFVKPVAPRINKPGFKDIVIDMKENKSREYSFSIGYGTVERGRTGVGLYNSNWRGSGQKVGLAAKLSFVEAGMEASFSEPWTYNTRWSTDLAFSAEYLIDPAYDQKTLGGRITIGRMLKNRISTNLTYRHLNVTLARVKVEAMPENLTAHIRSLKLTFTRDTRDNLFNPTKGLYLEQSTETAGLFRAASESFTRIIIRAKYFKTVTTGTVIASGIETAWMNSPRGFTSILLSERLYAGGPSSIRGFRYKKVGPLDPNGYPFGGGFRFVWNAVEIRQSIYKILGCALFVDVGNVWQDIDHSSFSDIRYSPGLGLRLNTTFGLFRIDYGFNPGARDGEPPGMLFFSVGQTF